MPQSVPGPKTRSPLGHAFQLAQDPLGFFAELAREFGDVASFRLGLNRYVFLNHPEYVDQLLRSSQAPRSSITRIALRSILGDGLLSLEGLEHRRHRRLMQPAFHADRLRAYAALMVQECESAIERWADGPVLDLRKAMMQLTFQIVSRTLFSADTSQEAELVDRALRAVSPAVLNYVNLARLVPLSFSPLYSPGTQRVIRELGELVTRLVSTRRREARDREDLLAMLMNARDESGEGLSDLEVASEALSILLAGHETTAQTLTWAFFLLQHHGQIAGALAAEAHQVAGTNSLRFEDLPKLALSERVVKETMRLYPAAWFGERVPLEPLHFGQITVPAETNVLFSVYVLHRDRRFFEDPHTFDPDRFSPERVRGMPRGAYLPFGAGVHTCIGSTFAMLTARIILSCFAHRVDVVPVERPRGVIRPNITLEMAHPMPVLFQKREAVKTRDGLASLPQLTLVR